ncbi:MAG: hypothetical protein JWO20_1285, partial [Candidatus Angelobacter sp.]|nr:hypothetical protein [Candidatus Angelobacter sp.]
MRFKEFLVRFALAALVGFLSLSFNLYSQESQRDRTTNLPNGQSLANGTKSIPIN